MATPWRSVLALLGVASPLLAASEVVLEEASTAADGVVTDVWGIPNSGVPEGDAPGKLCLTQGMTKPSFFQAGLATSACEVTGIPCKVTAAGIAYIAYDEEAGALSAFVTFQNLNPFSNGDLGSPAKFPGAQTPIIGMHLHQGNSSVNGPIAVFFCGQAPLPSMDGLPACGQATNQVYKGYFQQEDGSFTTQANAAFKNYLKVNSVTALNVQNFLYYNLHSTYSFAETQGNGLIRAQLVATGSPPAFALDGCSSGSTSDTVEGGSCLNAVPGSACFRNVAWAMSHGIQQHPDWYPGLSTASTFDEFQAFLFKTKAADSECLAPCSPKRRRLRGPA